MRTIFTILFAVLATLGVKAQSDPEYRAELGGGVGMVAYQGDFNSSLSASMQPMGTLLGRYRFNPRMGLALNVSYGKIKGSSADVETWYPDYQVETYEFDHSIIDAGLRYEYNFWPFGTGREYFGAKKLTPYIFVGLGMTCVTGEGTAFTANMPVGAGVKYKLATRLNAGVEWAMHFSMSDKLDGVVDPYGVESSGIFKNTDCYSHLRLTLTYDIWQKCKTCNNDDY